MKQNRHGKKPTDKRLSKTAKPTPVSPYPTGWYLMHPGDCTVQDIKSAFAGSTDPDVEVWRELEVVELTWQDKSFWDFQKVPCDLEDEASNAFLAEHGIHTLYWLTVEPVCDEAGLARLRETAKALGCMICADTRDFTPILR